MTAISIMIEGQDGLAWPRWTASWKASARSALSWPTRRAIS